MRKTQQLHGRDHAVNGADPIPGSGAAPAMWPLGYELVNRTIGMSSFAYELADWNYVNAAGTPASPFGWYIESTLTGDDQIFFVRLGPKGSLWHAQWQGLFGADCGKFKLSFATVSEDGSGGDFADPTGTIDDDRDNMDWQYDAGMGWNDDLYTAGADAWMHSRSLSSPNDRLRLMGEDGVAATTLTQNVGESVWETDGGAGLYAIKLEGDGKNASSSAFRKRLTGLILIRMTENFFPVSF